MSFRHRGHPPGRVLHRSPTINWETDEGADIQTCVNCGASTPTDAFRCDECGAPISIKVVDPRESVPLSERQATNTPGDGDAPIPPEIRGWNWGAFLISGFWSIGNRVWIGLLAFVPIGSVVMPFVLGAKGNEWAWRRKAWWDVAEFKRTQRRWAWWGLGAWVGGFALGAFAVGTGAFDASGQLDNELSNDVVHLTMSVPESWNEDTSLDESADLAAAWEFGDAYAVVYSHPKVDFVEGFSLREFTRLTTREFIKGISGDREGDVEQTAIDGHYALQQTISGEADGVKVTYLYTTIETSNRYIQVLTWSLTSEFPEMEEVLLEVTESLRVPEVPVEPGEVG